MNSHEFIRIWSRVDLPEQAASQQHFLNLCELLGIKKPAEIDPTGDVFTFEKPVSVSGAASLGSQGARGYADVWYKDRFGWEYKRKGKYKDLAEALRQLRIYAPDLGNPPLLIVSDINRTEIHTNFTGFKPERYEIPLEELTDPDKLDLLRRAFTDPNSFKPSETPEQVTEQASSKIGAIARGLRDRGHDPHDTAHFLMKVMFCLFAEDVSLLPRALSEPGLFEKMLSACRHDPARLKKQMDALFNAMREGGDFGIDEIPYFNGGLFDHSPALELTEPEITSLIVAASKDWSKVEPSVFGTLFERSLDPAKRSQIGAHYTSRDDIMLVIEPVIVRQLRREWDEVRASVNEQLERRRAAKTKATKAKADQTIADLIDGFQIRLSSVRVLDPACGSGNFLYVAIQCLLDLELEVIIAASQPEIGLGLFPRVRPTQLAGIEINPYAAELAQVVIWIGYLQWMRDNSFAVPRNPILEEIKTIENRDAILAWETEDGEPLNAWREGAVCTGKAEWPEADFIVGNPPFLGTKMLRGGLGDAYVEAMFAAFQGTIPGFSDLCCYWLELAGSLTRELPSTRVGLISTQAIRNTKARMVIQRIQSHSAIFDAWADEKWVLDGAAVHIAIVCFKGGAEPEVTFLNGLPVDAITASLSAGVDSKESVVLAENTNIGFIGDVKGGPFSLPFDEARPLLSTPTPNGRRPSEVVRPQVIASDIVRRSRGQWIVDFGVDQTIAEAASYGAAFEWVERNVKPAREAGRPTRSEWWLHMRPGPSMRTALESLPRFLSTGISDQSRNPG